MARAGLVRTTSVPRRFDEDSHDVADGHGPGAGRELQAVCGEVCSGRGRVLR